LTNHTHIYMPKTETTKEDLKLRVGILATALKRKVHWYTGLSIKSFLRNKIFNLRPEGFTNYPIDGGRWSGYAHFSPKQSFINMLSKFGIEKGAKVLVHPLLPAVFIDILIHKQIQITTLDIDPNTLQWPIQDLQNQLEQASKPNLIINYGFNGLYKFNQDLLELAQDQVVPTLTIIDNPNMDTSLLDLFQGLKNGGFIWLFGDSFLDEQLEIVLDDKLPGQPWYLSWNIEQRSRSILEYHLKESHNLYTPLIEAYFYLINQKLGESSLLFKPQMWLANKMVLQSKFATAKEAEMTLKRYYSRIFDSAVPDIIFELQDKTPVSYKDYGHSQLIMQATYEITSKAKEIYNHLQNNLELMPAGSLQIPELYLDHGYLKYFFYTTDQQYWYNIFQPTMEVEKLPPLHQIFAKSDLENAKIISEYALIIDLPKAINHPLAK
jgi:hypothetical protein